MSEAGLNIPTMGWAMSSQHCRCRYESGSGRTKDLITRSLVQTGKVGSK